MVMKYGLIVVALLALTGETEAQSVFQRADSMMTLRYHKGDIDTTYITRPQTKWTLTARLNVSGAEIETDGMEGGHHFKSEMQADYKTTLSVGVTYLGFSLCASLNPLKMLGRYNDYELNFNSYGRRFGYDVIYQDARNFTGWSETEGLRTGDGTTETRLERITLPADLLSVKTLNMNAYYAFNSRRFSYPAAFSQSYIQHRSAGSILLGASAMAQEGTVNGEKLNMQQMKYKMTNIGLGAGYGYNYVPHQGWLLHISSIPTFIVYSNTSMSYGDTKVSMKHRFPEVIITGRGAVIYQWRNKFLGMSMVFNFTNIGHEESLAVHNVKWRLRTFFGLRL